MRKSLLTVVCGLAAATAVAQDVPNTITFEDALHRTFSCNESIRAMEYEAKAAKRERQAAIGLFMPNVSVNGAYTYMQRDIGLDFNNLKAPVKEGATNLIQGLMQDPKIAEYLQPLLPDINAGMGALLGLNWGIPLQRQSVGFVGGNVTMPIFLGGKIIVANKAAKIKEQGVNQSIAQQKGQLVSELVERYYGYALARDVVNVREKVVEGIEHHLKDVNALKNNGMATETEKLYVEYKLAEARRELMNSKLQIETIASALQSTLGSNDQKFEPVSAMFVLTNIESLDFYKTCASSQSHILGQVESTKQLAKQNVNLHRSSFFPQIVATGGARFYDYQVTRLLPKWAVGVGFSFKIFDGLNREFKYSAAKQTLRRVESIQSKAEKDILVLVEKSYTEMENYRQQIMSIEASIAFAEQYLKAKRCAYTEGLGTSSDLIDAELNLAKVRIERMQAAYQFDVALARLLEVSGMSSEFLAYSQRIDSKPIFYDLK